MKKYFLVCLATCAFSYHALAQDYTIYPTIPGTSIRDYNQPGTRVETGYGGRTNIYPTLPGTSILDFSQPGAIVEKGYGGDVMAYPTLPGTSIRDYSKSGYKIEER